MALDTFDLLMRAARRPESDEHTESQSDPGEDLALFIESNGERIITPESNHYEIFRQNEGFYYYGWVRRNHPDNHPSFRLYEVKPSAASGEVKRVVANRGNYFGKRAKYRRLEFPMDIEAIDRRLTEAGSPLLCHDSEFNRIANVILES